MKKRTKIGLRFLLPLMLLALCIGGCGNKEAQETMAEGTVTGDAQEGTEDTQEGTGAGEETQPPENGEEEQLPENGEEAQPSGTDETIQAEPDIEIDEETKEELTTQLLEENELDTSIVDNIRASRGCTFTLPEGFTEVEDMPGMYVTKRYPIDASTIYYVEMEKDISLQLMTEETFLTQMQNNFEQIYGMDVDIDLQSYEKIEIDGYPAFKILCSYTVDGIEITQLEYAINADKSYVITYSQTHEYDRMEEFEASAATIHVEVSK